MNELGWLLSFILLALILYQWRKNQRNSHQQLTQISSLEDELSQASANSKDPIQDLLDAFPSPLFSITSDREIIRCNQAAKQFFQGREILNRLTNEVFLDHPIQDAIAQSLTSYTSTSELINLPSTSPFTHKDHEQSYWNLHISIVGTGNEANEFQLMMHDQTEQVRSEHIRKDFVANASHELRTPLSIISGYLENLSEEETLRDTQSASMMVSTMNRHVERITRIIEEMLIISRLESGEASAINIAPFQLTGCVNEVLERLEPIIKKQNATVTTEVDDITLEGDRFYWTQIIFNLVENALKQNTDIPLAIQIKGTHLTPEKFRLEVIDNGIGIPANDLAFIFKRFYRVEKHHSQTQTKGTGLGLSIVKHAISAHGGSISATSTPGIETNFTVLCPVSPIPSS